VTHYYAQLGWPGEDELEGRRHEEVEIEIWDYKLWNFFRGSISISLKDIMKHKRMKNTYALDGVAHGDLSLELKWFGLLDH
jgi:hypothetical protein